MIRPYHIALIIHENSPELQRGKELPGIRRNLPVSLLGMQKALIQNVQRGAQHGIGKRIGVCGEKIRVVWKQDPANEQNKIQEGKKKQRDCETKGELHSTPEKMSGIHELL